MYSETLWTNVSCSREEVEQKTAEAVTYRVPEEHCGVAELLGSSAQVWPSGL